MIIYDQQITGNTIGAGWSFLSFIVSFLGALGGILVALSVKYSDSIMKSIAVSGAIVLSTVGSYLFLEGPMTLPMALGSIVAIIATQNYTFDAEISYKGPERKIETSPPPLSQAQGKDCCSGSTSSASFSLASSSAV